MTETEGNSSRSFWGRASSLRRLLFFLTADVLIICLSLFLAFFVYFEFSPNIRYLSLLAELVLVFV